MSDPSPLEVVIITPQYDPFKEPVFYRWLPRDTTIGYGALLGNEPRGRSTTQTELAALLDPEKRAALDDAGMTDMYWSDSELSADLVNYLATLGVTAVVVDPNAPPDEGEDEGDPP